MTNEKFNITELLEFYYNNKLPIPETIKNFNFQEVASKQCEFNHKGNSRAYNVLETIAINIVKNLPVEAYKDIFDLSWIKSETRNDSKLLYGALISKRFDAIELIIEKIELWQKENINNQLNPKTIRDINAEATGHASGFLEPMRDTIVNFSFKEMGINQKEIKQFIPLWEKSIELLNNMQHLRWINAKPNKNSNIWDSYKSVRDNYNDSLIKSLVEKPVLFELFEKVFKVLTPEQKKEIFLNSKDSENLIEKAIINENKKVIELFEKESLISPDNYKNALIKLSEYSLYNFSDNYPQSMNLWVYKKLANKIDEKDKKTIQAHELIGMLLSFKNNPVIINEIINDYPQIKNGNILEGQNNSLAEINFLLKISNDCGVPTETLFSKLDRDNENTVKSIDFLMEKIQPEKIKIPVNELKNCSLYEAVIEQICKVKNISYSKSEILFFESALKLCLDEPGINSKKIKI